MNISFVVFTRDGSPYMVVETSEEGTTFKPFSDSSKEVVDAFKDEYSKAKISREELVASLDTGMTVEGPIPPSAVPAKIRAAKRTAEKLLPISFVSDTPIGHFSQHEFKNIVSFKASAFVVERYKTTFNYEVKRVRAVWDPSLSIPGTDRRGGWRCPVGTRYGGQITDRFGRNCGWGIARRIANAITNIGERLENVDDRRRGRRLERRNRRVIERLNDRRRTGRVERGLRGIAERLEGGDMPSTAPRTGRIERGLRRVASRLDGGDGDGRRDRTGRIEGGLRRIADQLDGGESSRRTPTVEERSPTPVRPKGPRARSERIVPESEQRPVAPARPRRPRAPVQRPVERASTPTPNAPEPERVVPNTRDTSVDDGTLVDEFLQANGFATSLMALRLERRPGIPALRSEYNNRHDGESLSELQKHNRALDGLIQDKANEQNRLWLEVKNFLREKNIRNAADLENLTPEERRQFGRLVNEYLDAEIGVFQYRLEQRVVAEKIAEARLESASKLATEASRGNRRGDFADDSSLLDAIAEFAGNDGETAQDDVLNGIGRPWDDIAAEMEADYGMERGSRLYRLADQLNENWEVLDIQASDRLEDIRQVLDEWGVGPGELDNLTDEQKDELKGLIRDYAIAKGKANDVWNQKAWVEEFQEELSRAASGSGGGAPTPTPDAPRSATPAQRGFAIADLFVPDMDDVAAIQRAEAAVMRDRNRNIIDIARAEYDEFAGVTNAGGVADEVLRDIARNMSDDELQTAIDRAKDGYKNAMLDYARQARALNLAIEQGDDEDIQRKMNALISLHMLLDRHNQHHLTYSQEARRRNNDRNAPRSLSRARGQASGERASRAASRRPANGDVPDAVQPPARSARRTVNAGGNAPEGGEVARPEGGVPAPSEGRLKRELIGQVESAILAGQEKWRKQAGEYLIQRHGRDGDLPWKDMTREKFMAMSEAEKKQFLGSLYSHDLIRGTNGKLYRIRTTSVDRWAGGQYHINGEIDEINEDGAVVRMSIGSFSRTVNSGLGVVNNNSLKIRAEQDKRNGIATIFNNYAWMGLQAIGVDRAKVSTGSDGPYVWAKMGYQRGDIGAAGRQNLGRALKDFRDGKNGIIKTPEQAALIDALLSAKNPDGLYRTLTHQEMIFALLHGMTPEEKKNRENEVKQWLIANARFGGGELEFAKNLIVSDPRQFVSQPKEPSARSRRTSSGRRRSRVAELQRLIDEHNERNNEAAPMPRSLAWRTTRPEERLQGAAIDSLAPAVIEQIRRGGLDIDEEIARRREEWQQNLNFERAFIEAMEADRLEENISSQARRVERQREKIRALAQQVNQAALAIAGRTDGAQLTGDEQRLVGQYVFDMSVLQRDMEKLDILQSALERRRAAERTPTPPPTPPSAPTPPAPRRRPARPRRPRGGANQGGQVAGDKNVPRVDDLNPVARVAVPLDRRVNNAGTLIIDRQNGGLGRYQPVVNPEIKNSTDAIDYVRRGGDISRVPHQYWFEAIKANSSESETDKTKRFKEIPKNGGNIGYTALFVIRDADGKGTRQGWVLKAADDEEQIGELVGWNLQAMLGINAGGAVMDGRKQGMGNFVIIPMATNDIPEGAAIVPSRFGDGGRNFRANQLDKNSESFGGRIVNFALNYLLGVDDRHGGNGFGQVVKLPDGREVPVVVGWDFGWALQSSHGGSIASYERVFGMDQQIVKKIRAAIQGQPAGEQLPLPFTTGQRQKIQRDAVTALRDMKEKMDALLARGRDAFIREALMNFPNAPRAQRPLDVAEMEDLAGRMYDRIEEKIVELGALADTLEGIRIR